MQKEDVKDLRVRTKEFALRIVRMYSVLPKTTEAQVIGKQVLRSGTSVGANYREAYRARSKAEFISIVGIALKEAEETAYWLELLEEAGILPAQSLIEIRGEINELIAIMVATLKTARASSKPGGIK